MANPNIDILQLLQFRGIKIIFQYGIEGRKIKNSDEEFLHKELNLSYLKTRRKRHLLHMMFTLIQRCPDMLDLRDKGMNLRSNENVNFKEDKLNYDVYIKSPYVRGCFLWKQLSSEIQKANTKKELDHLSTDELLEKLV